MSAKKQKEEEKVSKWTLEARELEAKAKALRREEEEFWKTVDEMREDILLRFDVGQKAEKVSDTHTAIIGEMVESICGSITNEDTFREYLQKYADAIRRTQHADDYTEGYGSSF